MQAKVYWTDERFPGRIAIVPRPRGSDWIEDEAAAWRKAGINVIVSMLETEEIETFELSREAEFCENNGISFFSFPVADRRVPVSEKEMFKLADKLKTLLGKGQNIGIHCRQSIGRAALMAAAIMVLFGISAEKAFQKISETRGLEVPETDEQRMWIENFAKELSMQSV